jgi:hypothetical protein
MKCLPVDVSKDSFVVEAIASERLPCELWPESGWVARKPGGLLSSEWQNLPSGFFIGLVFSGMAVHALRLGLLGNADRVVTFIGRGD